MTTAQSAPKKTAGKATGSSRKARLSAARLFAVQAVYQMLTSGERGGGVFEQFVEHRIGQSVDGETLVRPDGTLFKGIVEGVDSRREDLERFLQGHTRTGAEPELLLKSILLCGAYELMAHPDIDAPIIIADYLHVTRAFFEGRESAFINGVLDALRKSLRPE